jgi:hypothetical protein
MKFLSSEKKDPVKIYRTLKRMSHPLYSLDLSASDFYLSGTVKQRLQTCQGQSFEELQENGHEILASIGPTELAATMRAWIERLQRVTQTNREYMTPKLVCFFSVS